MRYLLAIICASLVTVSAFARLLSNKDPLNGVLDAQLVVIVMQLPGERPGMFRITEEFLGDRAVGGSIDLGDFKLSIPQESGPDIVEPITSATPILLFLQKSKDSPTRWEPTYFGESFFWVENLQNSGLLRRTAERAVELRGQWEQAAHTSDPKQRVAALWPFLSFTYGVSFYEHTEAELKKAAPAEFFAVRFDDERMVARSLTRKQHGNLRSQLEQQQHVYEEFISASGRLPKDVEWKTLPEKLQDAIRGISSGLHELDAFHDRDDLPLIRAAAFWSVRYHQERIAYAAVDAFRDMPDHANLPVIDTLIKEFQSGYKPGTWTGVVWDAERTLCEYRYPETVPLLAPFVADDFTGRGAQFCLKEIVGSDLGRNPKAWIEWYGISREVSLTLSKTRTPE